MASKPVGFFFLSSFFRHRSIEVGGPLSRGTRRQEISPARQRKLTDVHDEDMQIPGIMQRAPMRHSMLRKSRPAARRYEN